LTRSSITSYDAAALTKPANAPAPAVTTAGTVEYESAGADANTTTT
jgi:hypothetical protein